MLTPIEELRIGSVVEPASDGLRIVLGVHLSCGDVHGERNPYVTWLMSSGEVRWYRYSPGTVLWIIEEEKPPSAERSIKEG